MKAKLITFVRGLSNGTPPRFQSYLKSLTLILTLLLSVNLWGTDFTLSSAGSVTKDGITVAFAQGKGSTAPTWYDAGLRLYASNTVTISSSNNITAITFNWEKQGKKDFASASASTGTYSHPSSAGAGTWTGSAKSITFTLGGSGQLQLNTLSVTAAAPSYTVNWTINPATGGTLSATSGTSTTVTPNSAYTYGSPAYTVTSGSATVSQSTNTFTATPSANCTIRINMIEKPKYTVTLKDDNSTLTQASVGASVTLPSRTGCTGYTFAGWTKSWTSEQSSWTTTAPTIIPAGSYTPEGNENLYPVYTKTESGSGFSKYEKVTSAPSDWSGKYLFSTGTATATGYNNSEHFSSTSLYPGTTEYASYEFTLTKVGTVGYSIKEPAGKYVGWDDSGTAFKTSNTAPTTSDTKYLWTPATNGYTSNVSASARKIAYNGSSDFRPYSNPSSGATYLYKRIEGGPTTSYISVPNCVSTYTLDLTASPGEYGTVSPTRVTGIPENSVVTVNGNEFTVNETTVGATPTPQTEQYTYAFSNWTGIPSSGKITADVTITANFTRTARTYNVTYKDQGGGDYSGNNAGSLVANYTYGTGATLVAGTKYGFNFEGWYESSDCTGAAVTNISNSTTGDKTYYAKWSEDLSCSWNLQGTFTASQWQLISMSKETGHSAENVAYVTQHINAGNYWFKFYNSNGNYDIGAKIGIHDTNENFTMCSSEETSADLEARVSGDYRFKLDWSTDFNCPTISVYYPAYVTVTFNMNGHGDAIADKYCVLGGKVAQPSDPSAANYSFGGWYENASCTGDAFSFSTTLNANKTLYAKWTFEAPTYYYRGEDNSWGATEMTPSADHLYSYIQSSNSTNQFKISKTTTGYDYNYSKIDKGFNGTNVENIGDYGKDNCYCWQSGTYYIIVYYPNTAINSSSDPKICASTSLPGNFYVDGGAKLYFDNTLGNWAEGKQHLRIGRNDHSMAVPMTKVTGTANLYQCTVPEYANYFAFTVANSAGWTGDGNTIYQPSDKQPTGEYAITEELTYQNYLLDIDYTLLPTSKGSTDKGCTYINTNHEPGMKMQNVSITEYSHGTVNVAYTDIDGSALNFTTGNRNVAHTCILTITATPETGARLVSLKVNGNDFTSGQTFVADATTEITAVFSNEWTLTWDYADGTVVSAGTAAGSVAYGTSLTAPILEKTGYDFAGWNPTVPATMPAANSTYTAQWTLAQYTINPLNLTGCSVTGTAWPTGTKAYGSSFSTTISANDGYDLPSEISVTGATYTWKAETGVLTITSVIGDVTVSIVAVEKTYVNYRTSCTTVTTVTLAKGDHGTANGSATIKLGTSTFSSWTGVVAAEHFDLIGYYDGDTKVIDENGTLVSNVSGWTTSDGKWDKDATTATLTAKFTQRTYTVTTNDNGVVENQVVNEGESYTLPALSCESDDFEKVGWTKTAPVNNGWASKPTLAGATVSEGGTYYAVYGEGSGPTPTNTYRQIGSAEYESDKNYMIIMQDDDYENFYALNNTFQEGTEDDYANLGLTPITITDEITTGTDATVWRIKGSLHSVTIYNATAGKYIRQDDEYKDVHFGSPATAIAIAFPWEEDEDFPGEEISIKLGNDKWEYPYLAYYNGHCEVSSNIGINYLYKQVIEEGGVSYISNPVCCVDKVAAPEVNGATKTHNSITLSWSNVTGATGYKVTINGGTHDVTTSSCSYTESDLTPNTAYSWTVVATWDPSGAYCGAIPANGSTTTNPVYTVTYVKAGSETGAVPTDANTYPQGGSVTVAGMNTLSYSGYDFAGWKCSQDDETYTEGETVMMGSDNMTFTAVWTPKKDTYFDDIHKTTGYTGDGHIEEGKYTVPTLEDDRGGSNSCEMGHSVFVGWVAESSTNPDGTLKSGFTIVYGGTENKAANNIKYHAVWAESGK